MVLALCMCAGGPMGVCVCTCVPGCAWWAGHLAVFEGYSLGTEKAWQRPGQHREVAGLLTKASSQEQAFLRLDAQLGDRDHARPTCPFGSVLRAHSQSSPAHP